MRHVANRMILAAGASLVLASVSGRADQPSPTAGAAQTLTQRLGVYVFPTKGQSPAQQNSDENECFSWAKTNSGIDPFALSSQTAASQPQPAAQNTSGAPNPGGGAAVKGAAGGAAGGAAVGAIAGNAGKGAAIGATVGVLHGARAKRQAQKQAQVQQQQSQAAASAQSVAQSSQLRSSYNKAFSACLEGKGYTVK